MNYEKKRQLTIQEIYKELFEEFEEEYKLNQEVRQQFSMIIQGIEKNFSKDCQGYKLNDYVIVFLLLTIQKHIYLNLKNNAESHQG